MTGSDAYKHRTAWATAGNAVLFVDPNGLNTIRDADQYIFTDWDPSATSDMEALRNVFDTNHDGKLDAGDAGFGQFKLMVTNADGTTTVETLAQAGITSIDLTETATTQSFADGSSIDSTATFTRTDGTTGTAASVTYATDARGYAVQSTTTANADGSTTIDNRALNADGSLNNDTRSTTSADGNTRTIAYDTHGIGVVDHMQTITQAANADGSHTQRVSDFDGQGHLVDFTNTLTSANGRLVTIDRDTTGGVDASGAAVVDQIETRGTRTDGTVVDVLSTVSLNGTVSHQVDTTISADGLGREVDVDATGSGTYDHSTVTQTTVAGDGTRTETVTGTNHDGSKTDVAMTVTSADHATRTVSSDLDGDGVIDRIVGSQTTTDGAGAVTTTTTTFNGDRSQELGASATTVSADGLTKVTRMDMDGDGTWDRTVADIQATNANGGQTETVQTTSADGTSLGTVVTSRSTDGLQRKTTTYDGQGNVLSTDLVGTNSQGGIQEHSASYGIDGTLVGATDKLTSADGLTTTTKMDKDGDGTADRTIVDQTTENADGAGGSAEVIGTRSADGTLLGRTVVDTSADGLTVTTHVDSTGAVNADGTGVFDRNTSSSTSYGSDGSKVGTTAVSSADGTLLSGSTTTDSADRQTRTVTTDANGDGFATTSEEIRTAPDGTTSDKIVDLNPDGSHVDGTVRTTSANGLSTTTRIDASGTGSFNRVTTDDTTIADDGTRTETVVNAANDGTVLGHTIATYTSNGDVSTLMVDTSGDGNFDRNTRTARQFGQDGSRSLTITEYAADGTVRDRTTTTTSGNGTSTEVDHDLDGDGTLDRVTTMQMSYAANGDVTTTTYDAAGDNSTLYDQTSKTVSGDGRTTNSSASYYGSNFGSIDYSTSDVTGIGAAGDTYDDAYVYDAAGNTLREVFTVVSGDGLDKTVQTDLNGAGTYDIVDEDDTVLNADGSRTETSSSSGSAGLNDRTVATTSGNGLHRTVQADENGDGTVDTTTQDDTTLNADGSRHEAYSQKNQDGSLRDATTIDTSADGKHVAVGRVLGMDGSQAETIDRGADGTVTDKLSDTDGSGAAIGGETVTTSANNLVKTATYTDAAGNAVDVQTDTRTLGTDGSTTEVFNDRDSAGGVNASFTTKTQGNGLSKHTDASFNGFLANYSVDDNTALDANGITENDIVAHNADGSERSERYSTVSADGLATASATDEGGQGTFSITADDVRSTDGSDSKTTTIYNSDTDAQDRQDIVTTSADGRTLTLKSARDGDPAYNYTETTVRNADGTYSDKSQFVSDTLAPGWTQTRTSSLDTTGGQTVVISDYGADGGLDDRATTTVNGNGLDRQTLLDTDGNGQNDLLRGDTTVLKADGSREEIVTSSLAPGSASYTAGSINFGRQIDTSADGLTVHTQTDDDGNGVNEKVETSVRGIDGSLTDTVNFFDNSTGEAVQALASDGSTSGSVVKTTSADGLIVTSTTGDVVDHKTYVASSNGSYRWTEDYGGVTAQFSGSHDVDVNGIDSWTASYIPDSNFGSGPNTTTTIQISVAKEQAAVAEANAIYQTWLNRPMNDYEQEGLIQYMHGGILDQHALAASLVYGSAYYDLNFIQKAYENDFGHDASASDTAAYLKELQSGDRNQTRADVLVDIAEKAVNEQAGNGLLALLPDAPTAKTGTVTLISAATAAATDTGQNYATFTNAIGKPSGNLTPGQISQFGTLVGNPNAASGPQVNFASASSSTSGQGTAVPGFFSSNGTSAKPPSGGAAGPLVINLAGGKVHTTDLATSTVKFDDTASGTASTTAWTTANEGFLVLDPQGKQVTDGSSMIPTFAALAKYDTNNDGTLTAAEADSAGLKIWVDANGDGVDQQGEVESLDQAGIASIDLKHATSTGSYDNGNITAADSTVTFSNGTTGDIADAWLAYGGALSGGATYQFGDNVVTRATDGTASELLYGQNETVDAGAAGLAKVVDTGSNNVLEAGSAAVVTLSGASGDRMVGGSGADTLLALGDGETVSTGTGTNTVYASGANAAIDASLGSSNVTLAGASDSVTGATASTAIDVTKGTGARIAATGSKVSIEGGIGAEVSGSGVAVTAAGGSTIVLDASSSTLVSDAASNVTVNGSNDALTLDRASTVSVAGTGETVKLASGTVSLAAGASAAVTGNVDFVSQAAGSSLTLTGQDGAVDVSGTGGATTLDRGSVTLEDGASDVLTGASDQVVLGSNDILSVTGAGTVLAVMGTGDQTTLSDAKITIQTGAAAKVTGNHNVVTADHATLTLGDGSDATLTGGGDTVTIGNNATLAVSGNVNAITESGGQANVTVTGDGSVVTANGSSDVMTLTGSSVSAIAHGANATVNVTGQNSAIYVDGSNDAVHYSGTGATISAKNSSSVALADGSTATVDGNFNTVAIGTGTGVVLKGTGDALTASGANDFIVLSSSGESVSASAGTVTLAKQIGVSVSGNNDQVSVDNGDTLTLSGNGDAITVNGNGNTLAVSGTGDVVTETGRSNNAITLGKGSTTVTAGSLSVVQAANGNLSVYGGLASSAVTTSSSHPPVIALGNGNTVSSSATPAKIDGYAANGLHSWEEIFNTMSGALQEVDQYQYNASNQLMEIDHYTPSNVKTRADLYDPQTSAEIGSYLYASNGHVNEVIDMLHNHDWLSQSNGTYKDKTSGAVSKTQPTLR